MVALKVVGDRIRLLSSDSNEEVSEPTCKDLWRPCSVQSAHRPDSLNILTLREHMQQQESRKAGQQRVLSKQIAVFNFGSSRSTRFANILLSGQSWHLSSASVYDSLSLAQSMDGISKIPLIQLLFCIRGSSESLRRSLKYFVCLIKSTLSVMYLTPWTVEFSE